MAQDEITVHCRVLFLLTSGGAKVPIAPGGVRKGIVGGGSWGIGRDGGRKGRGAETVTKLYDRRRLV